MIFHSLDICQDSICIPFFTSPIATPATGALIGTPAAIKAIVEAQIEACEEEPLDSNTSETTLIV